MQDEDFLFQFESCVLSKDYFNHRGHLRIVWLYLSNYPFDQALTHTTQGILRYATSLGAQHIYHETLTRAWVYLVYKALETKALSFDDFINQHPYLLDKNLPLQYYSKVCLDSDLARKQWLAPDVKSF